MFLVPNTGDAILGVPLPRMNIAWRCAIRASIDMVPASFLSQVISGTLYLLLTISFLSPYYIPTHGSFYDVTTAQCNF